MRRAIIWGLGLLTAWSATLRAAPRTAPIDKKVATLIVCLEYGDAEARKNAIEALIKMGRSAAPAVPALAKVLDDADAQVRRYAIEALGGLGSAAAAAAPALAKRLTDDEPQLRYLAAQALGKIGPGAKAAVGALAKALKDKNPIVRTCSAEALTAIGANAKSAGPALVEALKDDVANARLAAAVACVRVGVPTPAVPVLAAFLTDGPPRLEAAQALAEVGPAAQPAVGALVKALKDRNDDVREHSALALGAIGPGAAEAVGALALALRDEQISVCVAAATALGRIGPAAAKAVPDLVRALKKGQDRVRDAAAVALKALGPKAEPAAAALVEALKDNHPLVRHAAADALVAIGKPAVPHLNKRVKDDDGKINMPVIRVLERIASPTPASAPTTRPAGRAQWLAITGQRAVKCHSRWRTMDRTFKMSRQMMLTADDIAGLLPPKTTKDKDKWKIDPDLAKSLAKRLFEQVEWDPTRDDVGNWMGNGQRRNESLTVEAELHGQQVAAPRPDGTRLVSVLLTGRFTFRQGHTIASRNGPNTYRAAWMMKVTGPVRMDLATQRLTYARLLLAGSVAGAWGSTDGLVLLESFTEKVTFAVRIKAPDRKDSSNTGHRLLNVPELAPAKGADRAAPR